MSSNSADRQDSRVGRSRLIRVRKPAAREKSAQVSSEFSSLAESGEVRHWLACSEDGVGAA